MLKTTFKNLELDSNTNNELNQRLDIFLAEKLSTSRVKAQQLIRSGCVNVNHKVITKPSFIVDNRDCQNVDVDQSYVPFFTQPKISPTEMALEVIYEDDYLLVVNKPADLLVHPTKFHETKTLANAVNHYLTSKGELPDFSSIDVASKRDGLIHRLDKQTSGLVIIAKNLRVLREVQKMFAEKLVNKVYLAIVKNSFRHQHVLIDLPIGRDPAGSNRMMVNSKINSKAAQTEAWLIKNYGDLSLVKVRLYTGRTHQIRVHFAYLGYPVLNDRLYGKIEFSDFNAHYLHAWKVVFYHPVTNEKLELVAKLPDYFAQKLNQLEKQ